MQTDGVIFDLDGTLWDATETLTQVWNMVAERDFPGVRPAITQEEMQSCMGLLLPDIGKKLFPMLTTAQQLAVVEAVGREERSILKRVGGNLYGGLSEMLQGLGARFPLFIVSNCQDGYIECFLEAHNMGVFFRDIECAGRTGLPKADNIALVARKYGLKAPVYVGDTELDGKSARQAGVPFVHARYGFGVTDDADAVIDSPRELLELLEAVK